MSSLIVQKGDNNKHLRFAYHNLMEEAVSVVASSESLDFPVENSYDANSYDFFKPGNVGESYIEIDLGVSKGADYFAFYGHNLHKTGGNIKLMYLAGDTWVDATALISPVDSKPKILFFDMIYAVKWRVIFNSTPVVSISTIMFGRHLQSETGVWSGFSSPYFADSDKEMVNKSEVGAVVGSSIVYEGISMSIPLKYLSRDWMYNNWIPFKEHFKKGKPFFFIWHNGLYPNEVAYCWKDGRTPKAKLQTYKHMQLTLKVRGLIE